MTDRRKLSDEDVQAIIKAMIEHESHCRFKSTDPIELAEAVTFFKNINVAINDSKQTIRQTLIKLLLAGLIGLLLLGAGVKIKSMIAS